jgi:hypothetical protein
LPSLSLSLSLSLSHSPSSRGVQRYTVMSFNGDLTKVTNEGEVLPLSSVKWAQK